MGPTSASFIRTLSDGPSNHDEAKAAHERLPVVVIRGFSSKGEAKQEVLWNTLAEWAAVLVENQVRLCSHPPLPFLVLTTIAGRPCHIHVRQHQRVEGPRSGSPQQALQHHLSHRRLPDLFPPVHFH
jgi:hypothetical protein